MLTKLFSTSLILICTLYVNVNGQCTSNLDTLGNSPNAFSSFSHYKNPIVCNPELQTVILIHRNDPNLFGMNSGILKYSISKDSGNTWQNNLDTLNSNLLFPARYPSVLIHNDSGNLDPELAHLSYLSNTLDGADWNGFASGTHPINNSTNGIETIDTTNQIFDVAFSPIQSNNNTYWHVNRILKTELTNIYGPYNYYVFQIVKGIWNSTTKNIDWSIIDTLNPSGSLINNSYFLPFSSPPRISFAPGGAVGYMAYLGHIGDFLPQTYHPIIYKTIDSGNTWLGPFQLELNTLTTSNDECVKQLANSCIDNYGLDLSTSFEFGLTVDKFGDAHLCSTLMMGQSTSVYFGNEKRVCDFKYSNGWAVANLRSTTKQRLVYGSGANIYFHDMEENCSRTLDGSKVFFTWVSGSSSPNIFAISLDVDSNKMTDPKLITNCHPSSFGKAIMTQIPPLVLPKPNGIYELPVCFTKIDPIDLLMPVQYEYIDNVDFAPNEYIFNYSVDSPIAPIILQGDTLSVCNNPPPIFIQKNDDYSSVAWYDYNGNYLASGDTLYNYPLLNGPITCWAYIGQCISLGATIFIKTFNNVSILPNDVNILLCPSETLSVSTNSATSYIWSIDDYSGLLDTFSTAQFTTIADLGYPYILNIFSVDANGCLGSNYVPVETANYPNQIYISYFGSGNNSTLLCQGDTLSINSSTYYLYYSTQILGPNQISPNQFLPNASATYTVLYQISPTCTISDSLLINAYPLPAYTIQVSPNDSICYGDLLTLSATGTDFAFWDNGLIPNGVPFYQIDSFQQYALVAWNNNGYCNIYDTIDITLLPLPNISIAVTPSTQICQGTSVILTASGGNNYTWNNISVTNGVPFSPNITPNIPYNYQVVASDAFGCTNVSEVDITILPKPSITALASPSNSTCIGSTTMLIGTGANSLTWSSGIINNIPFIASASATYTLTGVDANNCTSTTTIAILVSPLPNITAIASPADYVCTNTPVTINANGASTYTISNGINNGVAFTPSVTNNYTIAGTNSAGCTNTFIKVIGTGPCATCANNVVISTTPYAVLLQESQTYIKTQGSVLVQPNTFTVLDAAPTSYVLLQPGFKAEAGATFIAQALNGCTSGSPQRQILSAASNAINEITVYPNPTTGIVTIEHPSNLHQIDLYDFTGKKVMHINLVDGAIKSEIDIGQLPCGMYLLKAINYPNIKIIKQ